jgi:uncharacterized protein (TIGR03067 family)
MKALSFVAALMVVGFFAGAGLRADDDAAKGKDPGKTSGDLKKLQGTWTAPSGDGGESVYTFKDNKLTVKAPTRTYQMTVTLDESAEPHKTIDLKIDEAPEDAKGKTVKAIYKLDGDDKASLCFRPEGERPGKFEQVEVEQFLIELKRKKE